MTETDARAVLLVRTFEADAATGAAWSNADAEAADKAARREIGEAGTFEGWLVARARFAADRLRARDTSTATALRSAGWPGWIASVSIALALVAGIASDALGGAHRINLLAPPLLALVAWNIAVYVVLLVQAFRRKREVASGPLRRALVHTLTRVGGAADSKSVLPSFLRTWTTHAQPLYTARVATILHASAAALVLGALLSLYARGLVLEYRAGWDSTFLSPADVQAVLATALAPASWLSGIALPDTARIASIRFSTGTGENAAPWIHLYAITLALVVLVPRLVLAAVAAVRTARLSSAFPLPLDDPYFRRLQRAFSGQAVVMRVLPYSYSVAPAQRAALQRVLEQQTGARAELTVTDTLPLGAEDDIARWVGAEPAQLFIALFPLTATPELEQHGALVRALGAHAGPDHVQVLIDESGFRARFSGDTLAARMRERQQAWRDMLHELNAAPLFADLGAAQR